MAAVLCGISRLCYLQGSRRKLWLIIEGCKELFWRVKKQPFVLRGNRAAFVLVERCLVVEHYCSCGGLIPSHGSVPWSRACTCRVDVQNTGWLLAIA